MKEIVISVKCFNLKYTLECGQCFRWKKIDETEDSITYVGVIKDRVLKVKQSGNKLFITSSEEQNLLEVVTKYFDLNRNYEQIEKEISSIDKNVYEAVKNTSGIRHLNQDFFETLISFIISANNNIPRISKSIEMISRKFGKKIMFEKNEYFLFPTLNEFSKISKEELRKCGVGFRDSYIESTVCDMISNDFDFSNTLTIPTEILRKKLMKFKGVGPKVADCILLFSCKRGEVFPIDVWVEHVMSVLYFKEVNGTMSKKAILDYANNNFGKYAGIVQQHLFYNIREGIIKI